MVLLVDINQNIQYYYYFFNRASKSVLLDRNIRMAKLRIFLNLKYEISCIVQDTDQYVHFIFIIWYLVQIIPTL